MPTIPDMDPHDEQGLERMSTQEIKSNFSKLGKATLCAGGCSAIMYFILSSCFVWYSNLIPQACNRPYDSIFLWLGIWNGVMGVVTFGMAMAGREMLSAMAHAKLAKKYIREGRIEDASSEEESAEEDVQQATQMTAVPMCLYLLAQIGLMVCWMWGAFAMWGGNIACHGAESFFFWLLFFNCLASCLSAGSGFGNGRGYRRY